MIERTSTIGRRTLRAALSAVAMLWTGVSLADPVDRWGLEIAQASSRFEIPQSWIRRVMQVESGGQALVGGRPIVSRAGAIGLMQLMPGTWRDMRDSLGLGPDPSDPSDNILAGTFYLRLMYDRFGYPGLFAAYNAGPRRYAQSLTGARSVPAETRAYVAAIAPANALPALRARPAAAGLFAVGAATRQARAGSVQWPRARLFVALGGSPRP